MTGPTRKTIGSYEVDGELGQGGMGVVYLARQPALERQVVIKTLRRGLSSDASIEERFRREAQAAAGIHHQNVVTVYDCFVWRGERYIAQEYVSGDDLASVLKVIRRLDPRVAGLIALEIARGLEEVHAQDVVHRDLKPANVLLGRSGEVKIADFGIALEARNPTLTQLGLAVGTPAYMSPEQHRGERADSRSDLFAFGAVLYEMLTGEPPFSVTDDEKDSSWVQQMESGRYPPVRGLAPRTPRALNRLVRNCLRPRVKRRIQSATALRCTLERLFGDPSPAECRAEIAAWLWERKVFQANENETEFVSHPVTRNAPRKRLRLLAGSAGAAAAAAIVAAVGAVHFDALPVVRIPWIHGAPSATVRFDANPDTEVRIDDAIRFETAQSRTFELAPGPHRVIFRHPQLGVAERQIEVAAGEELTLRPGFESQPEAP